VVVMAERVLVLGATGRTGRCVVDEALARGKRVTAYVRSPSKVETKHDRLAVVKGEVTDTAALTLALAGHDAVISTLGQQRGSPPTLMRDAMAALVPAMKAAGARRLIALSGSGVKWPGDGPPPLLERLMVPVLGLVLPALIEDTRGYADAVAATDLDWIVARPMRLTNGPGGRPIRAEATLAYGLGNSIDRRDVARFLVDQLDSDTWLRMTPMITAG
jgi:uncharacterized protein YbjT (DUF2867 family)